MKLIHPSDNVHKSQLYCILGLYSDVITSDVYQLRGLLKSPIAGQIKTVIDIGANIGYFSILSACLFPNARKIAIEPDSWSYGLLCENLRGWDVHSIRAALGKSDVRMVSVQNNWSSVADECAISDTGDIYSLSLSDILTRYKVEPSGIALKIDCEGGEWALLQDVGLKEWVDAISHLVIEVHFKHGKRDDWMNWTTETFKGMNTEMRDLDQSGRLAMFTAKRW
jgi:FkbM family methyltransferase